MSTIKYDLEFFTYWHCGSGQAAGADVDSLVIKDKHNLPYVPGKTIKGLLRESAEILSDQKELVDLIFGVSGEKEYRKTGAAFFGNATLSKAERDYIDKDNLSQFLYHSIASTAINENGIAKDNSLRKTQVVVPCKLEGFISDIPEDDACKKLLVDSMKFIKRMGIGRTRGFGRCRFSVNKID